MMKVQESTGAGMPWILARILQEIEAHDTDYAYRNPLIYEALKFAGHLKLDHGIKIDTKDPEWPVAFIDLPIGEGKFVQVSWHLPQYSGSYDGHSTEEKYRRVRAYMVWARGEK